jgi:restriction endonuclease S subunit
MKAGWKMRPLDELISSKGGNNKLIKGTLSSEPDNRLFQAFSASGPDVWTSSAEYNGPGIVISAVGARCGKTFLASGKWTAIANTHVLIPGEHVDARWLWYLTNDEHFWVKGGSAQPFVKVKDTLRIPRLIPPLAEQKRIVAILDEAFKRIDEAKAKVEVNQSNSDGLYKSYLQSVFRERGSGWLDVKLDEVCGFQNGFAFKSNTFRPSGTPVIRISNIQDGIIDTENRLVFVNPKDYRENLDCYRVVEGDLLIAMSGATTGKIGFNTESREFYLNQRVGKFEPGKRLNKRFLYHFLSTKVEENLSISAGAAQPNLSTEQIKGFVLPLPPIEDQARIVASIEALLAEIRQLASLYTEKQLALAGLKNSLLIQAFAGELTA